MACAIISLMRHIYFNKLVSSVNNIDQTSEENPLFFLGKKFLDSCQDAINLGFYLQF